jgi:hypothetical protein
MGEFDRDILKAIKGHSQQSPQDLRGILAAVDARQRLILTHEELVGGVAQLIRAGQVVEAGNGKYYVPNSPPAVPSFSGISSERGITQLVFLVVLFALNRLRHLRRTDRTSQVSQSSTP